MTFLSMWTIYEHPSDYPQGYVTRKWIITGDGEGHPGAARYRPDLEAARAAVPADLHRIDRSPDDDPTVVETWI